MNPPKRWSLFLANWVKYGQRNGLKVLGIVICVNTLVQNPYSLVESEALSPYNRHANLDELYQIKHFTSWINKKVSVSASKKRPAAGKFTQLTRKKVIRIFQIQMAFTIAIAIAALLHSFVAAYSALLGGLLYLLPNAFFAWRVLSRQTDTPKGVLADMYIGEIWKMAISIFCFAAVFILVQPVSPFPLFLTFVLLQILNWYLQMKVDDRFLKL